MVADGVSKRFYGLFREIYLVDYQSIQYHFKPMPKPRIDIDREQVRMLVLQIGVRPAARQLGITESTVQYWCSKNKWLQSIRDAQKLPPGMTTPIKPIKSSNSSNRAKCTILEPARSPAEVMTDELAAHGGRSRIALARAATRSLEVAAETGVAIETAADLLQAARAASLAHGWDNQSGSKGRPMLTLNVLGTVTLGDVCE